MVDMNCAVLGVNREKHAGIFGLGSKTVVLHHVINLGWPSDSVTATTAFLYYPINRRAAGSRRSNSHSLSPLIRLFSFQINATITQEHHPYLFLC